MKNAARCICATFIRCLTDLEKIFAKFKRIVAVEMNDQGVYGFGQLATILRARFCEPKIESFTKTDGLTFRVKEILEGVFEGRSFAARKIPRDGAATVHADTSPENVKSAARSRAARSRLTILRMEDFS